MILAKDIDKKGLIVFSESESVAHSLAQQKLEISWELKQTVNISEKELKLLLKGYDVSVLCDQYSFMGPAIVERRSVGSHFLQYIDLVRKEAGQLWGYSLFSEAFKEVFLSSIQNQDFKGPVIFLGASPLALPIIQILAAFGFDDFVFLTLKEDRSLNKKLMDNLKGLLGIRVSVVDSAAFIQSQKEYSFCFVMSSNYPKQTLEDMSYFHFLSSKSMVFNAIGESNFLFKEIRALEVSVTDFEKILGSWMGALKKNLSNLPQ